VANGAFSSSSQRSLLIRCGSVFSLTTIVLSILLGQLIVLLFDGSELLHVLLEVWSSLKSDEKLGFLAVSS